MLPKQKQSKWCMYLHTVQFVCMYSIYENGQDMGSRDERSEQSSGRVEHRHRYSTGTGTGTGTHGVTATMSRGVENACNQKALKGLAGWTWLIWIWMLERPWAGLCFGLGLDNLQQQNKRDRVCWIWSLERVCVPVLYKYRLRTVREQQSAERPPYRVPPSRPIATTRVAFG